MNIHLAKSLFTRRRITTFALTLSIALMATYALPEAQTAAKKALTIDDCTKWRSITGQAISGDGKWIAYQVDPGAAQRARAGAEVADGGGALFEERGEPGPG